MEKMYMREGETKEETDVLEAQLLGAVSNEQKEETLANSLHSNAERQSNAK